MEWIFGLFGFICVLAFASEIHDKWHKREMIKAKHWKETIYV